MPARSHGMTRTKTYNSWRAMKDRVLHPNHYGYKWYAEKSVTICDKWMSFSGFLEDMGERPEGTTLDRIDNNKGYYKENCRWISMKFQRRNRSDTIRVEWKGMYKTLAEWAEYMGLLYQVFRTRRSEHWSVDRILSTPVRGFSSSMQQSPAQSRKSSKGMKSLQQPDG